jgi:hypothetical protein
MVSDMSIISDENYYGAWYDYNDVIFRSNSSGTQILRDCQLGDCVSSPSRNYANYSAYYNQNNLLAQQQGFLSGGFLFQVPSESELLNLSADGVIVQQTNNGIKIQNTEHTTTFDLAKKVMIIEFEEDSSNVMISTQRHYTYDPNFGLDVLSAVITIEEGPLMPSSQACIKKMSRTDYVFQAPNQADIVSRNSEKRGEFNFSVSPNPIEGQHATLSFEGYNKHDLIISVHNLRGQEITIRQIEPQDSYQLYFDANLPNGVYVIRVQQKDRVLVRKIIITR